MKPAVFLDRDGVLCENRDDYVKSLDEFVFLPGAAEAVATLRKAGLMVVVVTNQSAIGRGVVAAEAVREIHDTMLATLKTQGAEVDDVLVCPHAPEANCDCRKPKPGLLIQAAGEHQIDLARSWMVGDASSDIAAGAKAGCETVLVLTGRGADQMRYAVPGTIRATHVAPSITEAAEWILDRAAERGITPYIEGAGAAAGVEVQAP
jgi:D-glycero-D-manno-heptose 1,7-bisphosphate phosphatase